MHNKYIDVPHRSVSQSRQTPGSHFLLKSLILVTLPPRLQGCKANCKIPASSRVALRAVKPGGSGGSDHSSTHVRGCGLIMPFYFHCRCTCSHNTRRMYITSATSPARGSTVFARLFPRHRVDLQIGYLGLACLVPHPWDNLLCVGSLHSNLPKLPASLR